MNTDELIEQAHAETAAFFNRQEYDEGVCRELLRRAFAADQRACAGVCEVYLPLVLGWVRAQNGVKKTKEEPEYLANEAFRRFFRYLRPEQVASMRLAEALAYLRKCTASAVTAAGAACRTSAGAAAAQNPMVQARLNANAANLVRRRRRRRRWWWLWRRCWWLWRRFAEASPASARKQLGERCCCCCCCCLLYTSPSPRD